MTVEISEAYAGRGQNHVHINLLMGARLGPVGQAFYSALASPRPGHVPFLVLLQPNMPVWPPTLYINKAELRGDFHAGLVWGASQAGVAVGMREALLAGALDGKDLNELVIIIAVFIGWTADNEQAILNNSQEAMRSALLRAGGKESYAGNFMDDSLQPFNSFYRMPH